MPIPEAKNETIYDDGSLFNAVNPNPPPPSADSNETASPDGRMPAAFLGRWGLVPDDCTSARGDNKGLVTVEADRLTFYESRASIAKLVVLSPTELRVTLSFTGEGQEWTQDTPLTLENNDNVLTRFADGQTLRYTRCGA